MHSDWALCSDGRGGIWSMRPLGSASLAVAWASETRYQCSYTIPVVAAYVAEADPAIRGRSEAAFLHGRTW